MNELLIQTHGAVQVLTMNRPEKRNALNNNLTEALLAALQQADADESIGCVLLTGAGPAFCAGADIGEFKDLTPDQQERVERRAELTMQLHLAFSRMSKPVITAINGFAMGGGAGLALAADMALAAASAKIGYPEVKHGIIAAIVLPNLVRQLGRKAAFELVATGDVISSERALQLGMINRVLPDEELLPEALKLAERLASVSRPAMATTKRVFHTVVDLPLSQGLEVGREANKQMRSFLKSQA
nr:enoyl-CoA hydratase/isomerase family protein [uncultured Pseudogulbenkiania sp.]